MNYIQTEWIFWPQFCLFASTGLIKINSTIVIKILYSVYNNEENDCRKSKTSGVISFAVEINDNHDYCM